MANKYRILNLSSGLIGIISNNNTLVIPKIGTSVANYSTNGAEITYVANTDIDFNFIVDSYANVSTPATANQSELVSAIQDILDSGSNGALVSPITEVSTNTTIDSSYGTVLVDASGGDVTITLPDADGNKGVIFNIKKIDSSAYTVIIDGDTDDQIDGELTQIISSQYDSLSLQSDNTNWYII